MSSIHSLVYQPEPSEHTPPYHYNRVPVDCVNLIAGHGIEGDRKAGHHPDRHLNIMSLDDVRSLAQEGWKTEPGQLGEQIVISGLDIASLAPGTRLQFGDSAVIEVVKLRTGCDWLELIQGKKPADAAGRLGVMARVVASGAVCTGAQVVVIQTAAQAG